MFPLHEVECFIRHTLNVVIDLPVADCQNAQSRLTHLDETAIQSSNSIR